jgi:hypothetical protein
MHSWVWRLYSLGGGDFILWGVATLVSGVWRLYSLGCGDFIFLVVATLFSGVWRLDACFGCGDLMHPGGWRPDACLRGDPVRTPSLFGGM